MVNKTRNKVQMKNIIKMNQKFTETVVFLYQSGVHVVNCNAHGRVYWKRPHEHIGIADFRATLA